MTNNSLLDHFKVYVRGHYFTYCWGPGSGLGLGIVGLSAFAIRRPEVEYP